MSLKECYATSGYKMRRVSYGFLMLEYGLNVLIFNNDTLRYGFQGKIWQLAMKA